MSTETAADGQLRSPREGRIERLGTLALAVGFALGAVPLLSGSTFGTLQAAAFLSGGALLILGLALFAAPPSWRPATGRDRSSKLALALFLLGLGVRLAFIGHFGTTDPQLDLSWGADVHSHGLAAGYVGNYFPVEYQLFASIVVIHQAIGIKAVVLFKLANLLCDVGTYWALRCLLRRWSLNANLALWYWLTPYFVALDWLGYVDFHLGLMAVIALLLLVSRPTAKGYLLAGVPLGLMLLMKPQAVGLVLALVGWVAIRYWMSGRALGRRPIPALLFVAPAALFAVYSGYFAVNGFKPQHLAGTYSTVGEIMPALNAYMPNMWRIIGELYRHSTQPIEQVEKPHAFHYISLLLALAIVAAFLVRLERRRPSLQPAVSVLVVLAVGATVTPMVVTQAHENHFFLGGFFLLILALLTRSRRVLWGVQSLLLLMFINLFALYGFDLTVYRSPVRSLYTTPVQILVAAAATLMFAYGAWRAWNDEGFPAEVPERSASVPVAT